MVRVRIYGCSSMAIALGLLGAPNSAGAQSTPAAAGSPQAPSSADAAKNADSQAVALTEIVVTARKRSESLQSVPLSIVAVSGDPAGARRLLRGRYQSQLARRPCERECRGVSLEYPRPAN
jgi:outer membrane receptor protein involved in Fe transport